MVRLCSESSRSYSGRPVARSRRQRRGRWPGMAVVREQESAEAVVPEGNEPGDGSTGWTHNSGRAELGRQTRPSVVLSRSDEADWLSYRAAITVAEKECCFIPQGLSGTAVRGPACTVVWELGGAIPPATRLAEMVPIFISSLALALQTHKSPRPLLKRRIPILGLPRY